ncbi:MAG TPA: hypothetical protein DD423_03680 [Opitutae bacterium]|jgi:glycosyltransferase involved in cell wall biosynthesis|nr:hypothetical protein [Opitutae bacterium]
MKDSKTRLCFLSKSSPQHYKLLDRALLAEEYSVSNHSYKYSILNVLIFLKKLRSTDVVFSWFANSWLALLVPFIPRKIKIVVVAGGYDVANCVELKHGARFKLILGWLTRILLRRADAVLPVSDFNRMELLSMVTPRFERRVYNAIDLPEFSLIPGLRRRNRIITVGIFQEFISKCKGHYRLLEIAEFMPNYEFVIMGRDVDGTRAVLEAIAPVNVCFVDYIDRNDMICELLKSGVYLQLSYYESFGVSVAEAIACGCYPVVSKGTALPEVCGTNGVVVDGSVALSDVASLISSALDQELYLEIDAGSVRRRFSVDQRKREIVNVVDLVLSK